MLQSYKKESFCVESCNLYFFNYIKYYVIYGKKRKSNYMSRKNKNFKRTCFRKRCSVVCEFSVSADEVVETKTECGIS